MIKFLKKLFQIFLIVFGIFFFILTLTGTWSLFQPDPSHEQLVDECTQYIQQGRYSNWSDSEKLSACLEDSYRALGASSFGIFLIPIFALISWISLRFGLKIFKKNDL